MYHVVNTSMSLSRIRASIIEAHYPEECSDLNSEAAYRERLIGSEGRGRLSVIVVQGISLTLCRLVHLFVFFFQAEDGIRDLIVTGVQTCALPILNRILRSPQVEMNVRGDMHSRVTSRPDGM